MTDQAVKGDIAKAPVQPKRRGSTYRIVKVVHKWAGLTALAWLSVLGLTGYLLDHHEFRWLAQWTVSEDITSPRVLRLVRGTIMRYVEVDPADSTHWIGGSERGFWRTRDGGTTWQDIGFEGAEYQSGRHPQVLRIRQDPALGWDRLWLATDDGLWQFNPKSDQAKRFAFKGDYIHSLETGANDGELIGVDHHSKIFRIRTDDPQSVAWIDLKGAKVESLQEKVNLYRFMFDLHLGKALLPQPWGLWWHDYGGLAMAFLGLTGLAFWGLPHLWRMRKSKLKPKRRSQVLRWLFRSHGPVIGLVAAIPILYVSFTGILVDHIFLLIEMGKPIKMERASLPPAYQFPTLNKEIDEVLAYPGQPNRLKISTRLGTLDTTDGGRTWAYDAELGDVLAPGGDGNGAPRLFRHNDVVFALGAKNLYRGPADDTWQEIEGPTLTISHVSWRDGVWYMKTSRGIYEGMLGEPFTLTDIGYPPISGTPFFLFMADIHTGLILWSEWKWVNDFVSILAIMLVISGVWTWWKRKWV